MNNPYRSIKRVALAVGVLLTGFAASAQQAWFIYIQSDNQQPFYVQMGEKIYSSSAAGYLLLHSLKDSTYNLLVGFPQNQFPEQRFAVDINKKDQGYQLKKGGARQWELYNSLTGQALKPADGGKKSSSPLYGERKVNDRFADMMAAVVNDTAILYTSVVKKEPTVNNEVQTKSDSVKAVAANNNNKQQPVIEDSGRVIERVPASKTAILHSDSIATANTEKKTADKKIADSVKQTVAKQTGPLPAATDTQKVIITAAPKSTAVEKPAEPVPAGVEKVKERLENDSLTLTFLDHGTTGSDTVQVTIALMKEPVPPKEPVVQEPVKKDTAVVVTESPVEKKTDTAVVKKDTEKVKSDSALAVMPKQPEKQVDSAVAIVTATPTGEPEKKALSMVNSDCRNFASDNDIDKLRVRMLLESTAGDRMVAAQKLYKTHCLSAKQIKALSELFMTDETKYRFLEISYPHVSDTDNFKKLHELLNEEEFRTKFKALVRL